MQIKKHIIFKFTGEPGANGSVYAKECKLNNVYDDKILITAKFNEDTPVGFAKNWYLEDGNVYADLEIIDISKIQKNAYVVPAFEIIDPPYNPREDYKEQLKKPIKEVCIAMLGLTLKPSVEGLSKLPEELFKDKTLNQTKGDLDD